MRKTPMVPVALALTAGILAAHLIAVGLMPWALLTAAAALTIGIVFFLKRQAMAALWPVLILCSGIGGMLCTLTDPKTDPLDWHHGCPEQCQMAVHLRETPVPRERSIKMLADVESIDGRRCRGQIHLYLRPDSLGRTLAYGDRLLLHAWPDSVHSWLYTTSDHYIVTDRDNRSLRAKSEALRMRLLRRMQGGPLDARHTGIAEALTLGWRADLDPEVRASFRDAGIAHLLAVSGLHVGLVALIVRVLLFWVGRERRGRIVGGSLRLAAVWLFALLSGMAPSTVRAALMFSLFIAADIAGRRTSRLNLLAVAAIVTLACRPMLLFDVGWQLSYSAVAGILIARPMIAAFNNRLWQSAAVSMAATLATMPVTIATFHRIHPYFLIANVVIIPLSGLMLGLSLAYLAVPCSVTAWPLGIVIAAVDWLTATIASLPGASVTV
ncbi:MAG: ComEC/Rec2 family competence protein, partial [Bacteroidales bacterium]|nr:ComEC/Rec2 family competence protein [Bacteroidales bacterium]